MSTAARPDAVANPRRVDPEPRAAGGSRAQSPATSPGVLITPAGSWRELDPRELWRHRDLLWALASRDMKLRYRQTALGVAWAVLKPLCLMLVSTAVFGRYVSDPTSGMPYAVFAYAGLLIWTYFASAVGNASTSLVHQAPLVARIYFPRVLLPAATVLGGLVDLGAGFVLLVGLAFAYGLTPTWLFALSPLFVGLAVVLALALGTIMSALSVVYRDARHFFPFLIQLGLFVTPVIYSPRVIPERWRWLLTLNPMTAAIEGLRDTLQGRQPAWNHVALAAVLTMGLLLAAGALFRRMERHLADWV